MVGAGLVDNLIINFNNEWSPHCQAECKDCSPSLWRVRVDRRWVERGGRVGVANLNTDRGKYFFQCYFAYWCSW